MKKLTSILLVLVMLLAVSVSYAQGDQNFDQVPTDIEGDITIYQYYADADKINMDAAIAVMAEKYPSLKINIVHRSDSDGLTVKTWAAVGELPDAFEVNNIDAYYSMMENGDMYIMDDAIASTGYYSNFTNGEAGQLAHTSTDGHQYSIGCELNHVFLLWYNTELFEELGIKEPTNYEEFKESIVKLKAADKIPVALFGAEQWPAVSIFSLAAIAEGQNDACEAPLKGTGKFSDESFLKAAKKMEEIVDLGAFGSGALSTNYQQAYEMMYAGQAGYFASGTWFWLSLEAENMSEKIDWVNYNVFADESYAEEARTHAHGGSIREAQYAVNANPPSGLDPYVVSQLLCEFEYLAQKHNAELGNMTTVIGEFEFNGSENYADFATHYADYKTFNTFAGDISDGPLVAELGNNMELLISDNYTADEFIDAMVDAGF